MFATFASSFVENLDSFRCEWLCVNYPCDLGAFKVFGLLGGFWFSRCPANTASSAREATWNCTGFWWTACRFCSHCSKNVTAHDLSSWFEGTCRELPSFWPLVCVCVCADGWLCIQSVDQEHPIQKICGGAQNCDLEDPFAVCVHVLSTFCKPSNTLTLQGMSIFWDQSLMSVVCRSCWWWSFDLVALLLMFETSAYLSIFVLSVFFLTTRVE